MLPLSHRYPCHFWHAPVMMHQMHGNTLMPMLVKSVDCKVGTQCRCGGPALDPSNCRHIFVVETMSDGASVEMLTPLCFRKAIAIVQASQSKGYVADICPSGPHHAPLPFRVCIDPTCTTQGCITARPCSTLPSCSLLNACCTMHDFLMHCLSRPRSVAAWPEGMSSVAASALQACQWPQGGLCLKPSLVLCTYHNMNG